MICEEQKRLLDEYSAAMRELSRVTDALAKAPCSSIAHEYQSFRNKVEKAKARARKAQQAYEDHVATHGYEVLVRFE